MKAATETLDNVIVKRSSYKQNLCLDKGYDSSEIEREVIKRKYITHIRHRGEEKGLIKTRHSARRWVVVERTNSWHNRFRKLLVRYEKKSEKLSFIGVFSLLYYCLQEDNFGIGSKSPVKNVPVQVDGNVLVGELRHGIVPRSYIPEHKIKQIASEKYKSSGYGITFEDLTTRFRIKRPQAQRSLKHFHARGIFTGVDLINQGIDLIQNTNPQQYFPTCINADIIECFKKRKNVQVQHTRSTSQKIPYFQYAHSFQ